MKVLLSAYACEPFQGSEPGIGWNWAVELVNRNYEVYVLTRSNNRTVIEQVQLTEAQRANLHFLYYDLPDIWVKSKKKIGIYLYYNLWQLGAYRFIRRRFGKNYFPLVHHITFGSFRFPSFMHGLGGRFIIGPVGGGEQAGRELINTLPLNFRLREYLRNIINALNRFNILTNAGYRKSELIIATTPETAGRISKKWADKIMVSQAIGINHDDKKDLQPKRVNGAFKVLYAGVLVHWKGVHIAINAFSAFLNKNPQATLTIIGKGPFSEHLDKMVKEQNLAGSVFFKTWCPQDELWQYYASCDVFLFPSFHDSGGFVILEAMSFGKPVICLDAGAPAYFTGDSSNVINSAQPPDRIIGDIARRLTALSNNPEEYKTESLRLRERVKLFRWECTIANVYDHIVMHNQTSSVGLNSPV